MRHETNLLQLVHTDSHLDRAAAKRRLVIDLVQGTLCGAAGQVSIASMEQLRALFAVLVEARGEPVSLRDLYDHVWKARWVSPEHHRAAVHTQICRARRLLKRIGQHGRLVRSRAGYALKLDRHCETIVIPAELPVEPDVRAAIFTRVREHGSVTNRDIRRLLPKARTTVYRTFQRLVAAGQLVQVGGGRGCRYVLPEAVAAEKPAA